MLAVLCAVAIYSVLPTTERADTENSREESFLFLAGEDTPIPDKMTGETLPGRPGTLTPAEEEKLRELWIAVLKVFGVLEKDPEAVKETGTVRSENADSKKPTKKRMSIFRKTKDENPETLTTPKQGTSEDDKYGQTKEFHDALANMSPETLRATFWSMVKHDHPDALLLRFMRARKWDVEKALVMMISTMRWRSTEVHVDDDIMKNGELGSLEDANGSDAAKKKLGRDFIAQMSMGKSFLHGLDKSGRPMCFVRVRLHKQGEQSEESLERYTVFVIESARMILSPPVDTAVSVTLRDFMLPNLTLVQCVVFDMTGFSMANMVSDPVILVLFWGFFL